MKKLDSKVGNFNCYCAGHLAHDGNAADPASHSQPGVQLKSSTYDLQESNVNLKLTIVSTVGFGDQINKEDR